MKSSRSRTDDRRGPARWRCNRGQAGQVAVRSSSRRRESHRSASAGRPSPRQPGGPGGRVVGREGRAPSTRHGRRKSVGVFWLDGARVAAIGLVGGLSGWLHHAGFSGCELGWESVEAREALDHREAAGVELAVMYATAFRRAAEPSSRSSRDSLRGERCSMVSR